MASHAGGSEPCVQVRAEEGYACMKFSDEEKMAARSYGLRLGAPYQEVKRTLIHKGWKIDRVWVRDQPSMGPHRELLCGAGYDAVCSTVFLRGERRAYLTLSGTNAGTPLIAVEDHE